MRYFILVLVLTLGLVLSGCMSKAESDAWVSYYDNSGITFTCPETGCVDKRGNAAPSGPIKDISNTVKEVLTSNVALAWTVGKFAGDKISNSNNKTITKTTTQTRNSADGNTHVGGNLGNTVAEAPDLVAGAGAVVLGSGAKQVAIESGGGEVASEAGVITKTDGHSGAEANCEGEDCSQGKNANTGDQRQGDTGDTQGDTGDTINTNVVMDCQTHTTTDPVTFVTTTSTVCTPI